MNPELIAEAEDLWRRSDSIDNYFTEWSRYPPTELRNVYNGMVSLYGQIPEITHPQTRDELLESELQRKLGVRVNGYEHALTGAPFSLEEIVARVGLEPEEIDPEYLRGWLLENRDEALEALDTHYHLSKRNGKRRKPYMDIPKVKDQFVAFAAENITLFHQQLIDLTVAQSQVGNHLRGMDAEPTLKDRSYFSLHTRHMGYAIDKVCSQTETGEPALDHYQLLRLNGHERNGHALQLVLSKQSDLPFFMTDSSTASGAAEESLALHYEKVIFEDVHDDLETQQALGIEDIYDEVYGLYRARNAVTQYGRTLSNYSIALLAEKPTGDVPNDREILTLMEQFADVALDASEIYTFIGKQRYKYYPGGFYDPQEIDEIIYGSHAVQRVLDHFRNAGFDYNNRDHRSYIDRTLLTGYFTPRGLLDNARIATEQRAVPLPQNGDIHLYQLGNGDLIEIPPSTDHTIH